VLTGFAVADVGTWVVERPDLACELPATNAPGTCLLVHRDPPPTYHAIPRPGG
jgi:hypothetical protein